MPLTQSNPPSKLAIFDTSLLSMTAAGAPSEDRRASGSGPRTSLFSASSSAGEPLQRRGNGVTAASCRVFSSTSACRASHWDMRSPVSHISFWCSSAACAARSRSS